MEALWSPGPLGIGKALAVAGPRSEVSFTAHAIYQPASHFWPLQLIETGLYLGVAAALILFAALWTHQRTG